MNGVGKGVRKDIFFQIFTPRPTIILSSFNVHETVLRIHTGVKWMSKRRNKYTKRRFGT